MWWHWDGGIGERCNSLIIRTIAKVPRMSVLNVCTLPYAGEVVTAIGASSMEERMI